MDGPNPHLLSWFTPKGDTSSSSGSVGKFHDTLCFNLLLPTIFLPEELLYVRLSALCILGIGLGAASPHQHAEATDIRTAD